MDIFCGIGRGLALLRTNLKRIIACGPTSVGRQTGTNKVAYIGGSIPQALELVSDDDACAPCGGPFIGEDGCILRSTSFRRRISCSSFRHQRASYLCLTPRLALSSRQFLNESVDDEVGISNCNIVSRGPSRTITRLYCMPLTSTWRPRPTQVSDGDEL